LRRELLMRKALFALLALASVLIYPHSAHADTVTFQVSVVGSGSIGGDTFTDQRVTLSAFAPEEVFAEAFIEGFGDPSNFGVCLGPGASTATVQSIGTFAGPELPCIFNNFEGSGDLVIGDGEGGLGIVVSPFFADSLEHSVGPVFGNASVNFDEFCDPELHTQCPPAFGTYAGDLTFTSYEENTGTAALIVTSSTPEPSTFALLGTGLLGAAYFVRRRVAHI
jgi:hypothetical protein